MAERRDAEADVVVVGAGPAGCLAALLLARAGLSVCLVERGPYPGSKNVYGGVVYGRVLDGVIPDWTERIPVQRWVTRRQTMVLGGDRAVTLDVRVPAWGRYPYNGAVVLRSDLDSWLAREAVDAGAALVCSTTVTGLLRDSSGRVAGVRTDRDGQITTRLVLACDGVNSFLAKEAGLHRHDGAEHYTLGVKEVLAFPREEIEARFGVHGDEGVDIEILGGTAGVAGGGFVYTNRDSVAVGVVLSLPSLVAAKARPEAVLAELKAHPAVAPLVQGGSLKEYLAHLIPEGGYEALPRLYTDGMLVCGDAAGLCLAAGIWLEGVNFAMGSAVAAARTGIEALAAGDTSARALAGYRRRLEANFVLRDHRRLRRAPGLVLSPRVQGVYPDVVCDLAQEVFTVRNPEPKPPLARLLRSVLRRHRVRSYEAARDLYTVMRTYG